jgi:integrase
MLLTAAAVRDLAPAAKPYEVRDDRLRGFLIRVQPSGSKTFYIEYGRSKRIALGRADVLPPSVARDKAKAIVAQAVQGQDPRAARRQAKAHTLGSFLSEVYEPWARANLRTSDAPVIRIRTKFPELLDRKLADLSPWLIEKWRLRRKGDGIGNVTLNRDLDDLKAALARAAEWDIIEASPLAGIKRAKVDRAALVRFLSEDEERRLRAALDAREERIRRQRDSANDWRRERGYRLLPDLRAAAFADHLKPLVLLSLNTGIRRGEAFALTWHHIDLERAILTVAGASSKAGTTRHLPLNGEALATLTGWRAQAAGLDGLVFPGAGGAKLNNVHNSWQGLLKAAGIRRLRWHDLRHSFGSRLVMLGVDLNTVRELLGHSSYSMTLRYAHLAPEHRAAAVARLDAATPPRARPETPKSLTSL